MGLVSADLAEVIGRRAPILFLDTCVLFDLIRDVTRPDVQTHNLISAITLVTAAENGHTLTVVIASQVLTELENNRHSVEEEARSGLKKFRDQVSRINEVAIQFGATTTIDTTHLKDHVARASFMLQRLSQVAITALAGPEIERRAMRRVVQALAPSRKGKESAKDCLVIESYFEIADELRAAGFVERIVFISSNTREYLESSTKKLHTQLQADFEKRAIEYAPNYGAARYFLRI